MAAGAYKIPDPMKDEDKWLLFFTKKQALSLLIAVVIGIGSIVLFSKLHMFVIGLIICILLTLGTGIGVMITIPEDKYLMGGGLKIYVAVFRVLRKWIPKNRILYVKNYKKE